MIHIRQKDEEKPLCNALLLTRTIDLLEVNGVVQEPNAKVEHDSLTFVALESDCNTCRGIAGIALVNDKTWQGKNIGVKPQFVWEYKPPLVDPEGKVYERIKL